MLPSPHSTIAGILMLVWSLSSFIACEFGFKFSGLTRDEMLTKLRAHDGALLSSEQVFNILDSVRDSSWQVAGSLSVKELWNLHELTLDKCTVEELDRRNHSLIYAGNLTRNNSVHDTVRRYAANQFGQFVLYCARNINNLFQPYIRAIGVRIRENLSYFRRGVQANERQGLERAKSMDLYLTKGQYVNKQYKRTIRSGCMTVNGRLRHLVAIQDYAKQFNNYQLNFQHSLQEWMLLNEYCKLYIENNANK